MRLILTAVLVGCMLWQPLPACINDSATKADEQQFVSGYGTNGQNRKSTPPSEGFQPGMLLLALPSLALLGVGFFWLRQERALAARKMQRHLVRSSLSET